VGQRSGEDALVVTARAIEAHFKGREPIVRSTYLALIAMARTLGAVTEDPKKTSIHLVRSTAFAGVATRRSSLVLTLKSPTDIKSRRVTKREQVSARRWYLEVRVDSPQKIDKQIKTWLKRAYDLSA
jgi:hypothetical protein